MTDVPTDVAREERITRSVLADAYTPHERVLGWHTYLDEAIDWPVEVRCRTERAVSPLQIDEVVTAHEMAPVAACRNEMIVLIDWNGRKQGVPLAQLSPIDADAATTEAIADWRYWVAHGNELW